MKKYKKLLFTFSLFSLVGFIFGFMIANGQYPFGWATWFEFWLFNSIPLIILFIWTKIFD